MAFCSSSAYPYCGKNQMHIALPILWLLLPLFAYIGNRCRTNRLNGLLLFFATAFVGYFLLLAAVWAIDVDLKYKLNRFDKNGDGSFSDAEMTPAAERAMQEVTDDTGRALAPVIGLPYTGVWVFVCFSILYSAEWISKLFRKEPNDDESTPRTVRYPESDGNPYQPPGAG